MGKKIRPSNKTQACKMNTPPWDIFSQPWCLGNRSIRFSRVWINVSGGKESTGRLHQTTESS